MKNKLGVYGNDKLYEYFRGHARNKKGTSGCYEDLLYTILDDGNLNICSRQIVSRIVSFEEFVDWVERMDNPTYKKIVGYVLEDKDYEKAALVIAGEKKFSLINSIRSNVRYHFSYNSIIASRLREAKVLDLWFTPIYEEEKRLPTLVGYYGELQGDFLVYGCQKVHKSLFNRASCDLDSITIKGVKLSENEINQIRKFLNF